MRSIEIPADVMSKIIACDQGRSTIMPCKVDWPELQLTESQMLENAADHARGRNGRHPDLSFTSSWCSGGDAYRRLSSLWASSRVDTHGTRAEAAAPSR